MKDASPNYSVVTPVYNAARTLQPTIEALLRLEPQPRAIYIVDDRSTDGSREVARRYLEVTLVALETNQGPGNARNVGASMANTELLLMIDSDCYIDPHGFRIAWERMASEPRLAGIMGVPVRDTPSGPFAGRFKNYWYHLEFQAWGDPPRTLYGSCFFVRRDAYNAVGGFDASFGRTPCEDAEFYFRLVQAGYVFERRMDFTFVHDKTMTLRQLMRTSFERSVSIIQNMRGKLGTAGNPWKFREQALWAMEIGGGSAALAVAPLLAIAALASTSTPSGEAVFVTLGALWLLCVTMFFASVRDKIVFAFRDKGLAFAAKAFLYRMLEMPGVALGIAWGILTRRPIAEAKEHKA
jgi:GT2 family glycosyltransferase